MNWIRNRLEPAVLLLMMAMMLVSCRSINSDQAIQAYEKQVADLISKALAATSQEDQQQAFNSIINLGCDAAPAIAAALGDNRALPIPYLCLINDSPYAFEAITQYGPVTVTDALAAILGHLTERNFGFIYNGATDTEREKAVKGWQSFFSSSFSTMWCKDRPVNRTLCFSEATEKAN